MRKLEIHGKAGISPITSSDSRQSALSMSTTSPRGRVLSTVTSWAQEVRMLGNCAFMLAVLNALATAFLHVQETRTTFTKVPRSWSVFSICGYDGTRTLTKQTG